MVGVCSEWKSKEIYTTIRQRNLGIGVLYEFKIDELPTIAVRLTDFLLRLTVLAKATLRFVCAHLERPTYITVARVQRDTLAFTGEHQTRILKGSPHNFFVSLSAGWEKNAHTCLYGTVCSDPLIDSWILRSQVRNVWCSSLRTDGAYYTKAEGPLQPTNLGNLHGKA